MFTLELELTKACNLNCTYCFEKKVAYKIISFDESMERVQLAIKQANKLRTKEIYIDFTGGEPLLAFELIQRIVLLLESDNYNVYQFRYGLVTNGMKMEKRYIKFFEKYDFDLTLSLDGCRESHDLNRVQKDGSGSYEIVIKNCSELLLYYKPITVNMVITNNNYDNFFENFVHISDLGFKVIRTKLDINSIWKNNSLKKLKEQLYQCADIYFEMNKDGQILYWDFIEEGVKSITDKPRHFFCGAGIVSFLIAADDTIRCCGMCEDNGIIGDTNRGINNLEVEKLSKYIRTLTGRCIECNIAENCPQCDCIFLNDAFSNEKNKLDKFCDWYKIRYELSNYIIQKVKCYRGEGL